VTAPVTWKTTLTPGVGLPNPSVTLAVTAWLVATGFSDVVGASTIAAGAPATQVLVAGREGSSGPCTPSPSLSAKAVMASDPGAVGPA
jgi:hypothetical protein